MRLSKYKVLDLKSNQFLQKAARLKFARITLCVHTCPACQVCFIILASWAKWGPVWVLTGFACEPVKLFL